MQHDNPIIVALDVPTDTEALQWVERLGSAVPTFKVGMQLFYAYGPALVKEISARGCQVFLDIKLYDIPNTVARACESIAPLNCRFVTLHASGGVEMMQAAQSVFEGSGTTLLGVTALTSLNNTELQQIMHPDLNRQSWVPHLASLAQEAGLGGLVCSAYENQKIRDTVGSTMVLVNPGIRLEGDATDDQKQVVTPQVALKWGANYLVMGRAILNAPDPLERCIAICGALSSP